MSAATVVVTSAPASADHAVVERGAYAVTSTGLLDVGPVAHCAVTTALGECEREVASVSEVGLTTGVLSVRTTSTHDPAAADSAATVADAAFVLGLTPVFSAEVVTSTCAADESDVTGTTVLTDAAIAGVGTPAPFDVANPPPNTVAVDLLDLRIVLNEQVLSADRSRIDVNAVHITVLDPLTGAVLQDVVLASTQCSFRAVPTTTPPPPVPPTTPPPVPPTPLPEPEPEEVRGVVRTIDKCGRAGDSWRARTVAGVTYRVSGKVVRDGVWLKAKKRTVRVRAVATDERYEVVGRDVFVLRFTNKPCPRPPSVLPATGA